MIKLAYGIRGCWPVFITTTTTTTTTERVWNRILNMNISPVSELTEQYDIKFMIQTVTVVALIVAVVLTTVALCKYKQQRKKNATNELIRVIVTMAQHAAVADLTKEEEKGVTPYT